jgi:hypothetical protein
VKDAGASGFGPIHRQRDRGREGCRGRRGGPAPRRRRSSEWHGGAKTTTDLHGGTLEVTFCTIGRAVDSAEEVEFYGEMPLGL